MGDYLSVKGLLTGAFTALLFGVSAVCAVPTQAAPVFFELDATSSGQNDPRYLDGSPAAGIVRWENVPVSGFFTITDQAATDFDPDPLRAEFRWSFRNAEDLPGLHDFRVLFGNIESGEFTEQSDLAIQAAQFEVDVVVQASSSPSTTDQILVRFRGFHPDQFFAPADPYEIEFVFRPPFGTAPFNQQFPSTYVEAVALLRSALALQPVPTVNGQSEIVLLSEDLAQTITSEFTANAIDSPSAEPLSQPLLISRARDGGAANGDSTNVSMSADGQTLVFSSTATNLLESDSNGITSDIYLFDRRTGALSNLTAGANGDSSDPVLSKDGRWLAFVTRADNLPTDVEDANGPIDDIVLMSVETRALTLVTAGANAPSSMPSLDFGGRRMAFDTQATNLTANSSQPLGCSVAPAPAESRCVSNVMLYDRNAGSTILLTAGGQTDSDRSQISPSGRHVAFVSEFFHIGDIPGVMLMNVDTGERLRTPLRLENMSRPIVSQNLARFVAISGDRDLRGETHRGIQIFDRTQPFVMDSEGNVFPTTASSRPIVYLRSDNDLPGEFSTDRSRMVYTTTTLDRLVPDRNGSVRDVVSLDLTALPEIRQERVTSGGTGPSNQPVTNHNATLVAFQSSATNFGAADSAGRSNVYLLSTLAQIGAPPVANAQQITVQSGGSVSISLSGTSPAGTPLQYEITSEPVQGTLQGLPPELIYTPSAGFSGADEFRFRVNTGGLFSHSAVVAIDVTPAIPENNPGFELVAEQRADSRVIDITAAFPPEAVWSQVREFDGVTTTLRDGPAETWVGSFVPEPDATEVTFNSRYWLPGSVNEESALELTVLLRSPTTPVEQPLVTAIGGFAWIDSNADGFRDQQEPGVSERDISLFRCAPPWGIAGTATTDSSTGRFDFLDIPFGEYQLGTDIPTEGFTTLGGDNSFFDNGFTNCFDYNSEPVIVGLGLLGGGTATSPDSFAGFAWIDENFDGIRDADEPAESNREVTLFRCAAPYGQVGSAVTDEQGRFSVADLESGEYQLGTPIPENGFAPLGGDNVVHASGFANCVSVGDPPIGIGVLPPIF